jgi:hypothetical protein
MAEPVYISVNVPNILTIGFIVVVAWTLIAAGISISRQYIGGGSSNANNMAAAA